MTSFPLGLRFLCWRQLLTNSCVGPFCKALRISDFNAQYSRGTLLNQCSLTWWSSSLIIKMIAHSGLLPFLMSRRAVLGLTQVFLFLCRWAVGWVWRLPCGGVRSCRATSLSTAPRNPQADCRSWSAKSPHLYLQDFQIWCKRNG